MWTTTGSPFNGINFPVWPISKDGPVPPSVVWEGRLEWQERSEDGFTENFKEPRQTLLCRILCTRSEMETTTESGEDGWPGIMHMHLIPRKLLDDIGEDCWKTNHVTLLPQGSEELQSLTKTMTSGSAGIIHFPEDCFNSLMIVTFNQEKEIFDGHVLYRPSKFLQRIKVLRKAQNGSSDEGNIRGKAAPTQSDSGKCGRSQASPVNGSIAGPSNASSQKESEEISLKRSADQEGPDRDAKRRKESDTDSSESDTESNAALLHCVKCKTYDTVKEGCECDENLRASLLKLLGSRFNQIFFGSRFTMGVDLRLLLDRLPAAPRRSVPTIAKEAMKLFEDFLATHKKGECKEPGDGEYSIKEFRTLAEYLERKIWSKFLSYKWKHKTRKDVQDKVLEALADILPEPDIQRNKERICKIIIKKIVDKGDDAGWFSERWLVKELIAECLNKYFARLELESEVAKLDTH